MIESFKNYFKLHPLRAAIFLGLIFRLLAVIFSKGFGFHDDHFLIVEASQSWVDGEDYNNWLPSDSDPNRVPQGHSFLYVGLHFIIFKILTVFGLTDPQGKMYIVRFIHALWSMLIIYYGFKIAYKRANLNVASWVGLTLAVLWFMPFMSVRNLVEFVCIPPLLIATWHAVKNDFKLNVKDALLIGIWLGVAFSIRFQTILFSAGFGLALLLLRTSFKNIICIALGFLGIAFLTQGVVDYFIWHRPFAEFTEYVRYNLDNATTYGTNVWHMYFSIILGLLIPPLSIFLFYGYLKNWKKESILFWPSLFFLAFHTYFPNKQERFILPIIPFVVILGFIGFFQIIESKNWLTKKWFKNAMIFCLIINSILLPVLTLSYSKKNRVEAMCYVAKKEDLKMVMIDDFNRDDFLLPPLFYLGKWGSTIGVTKIAPPDTALKIFNRMQPNERPNYVIFMQAENINARVDSLRKRFPTLHYEATIEPSFIDKTMHFLNPVNDNQTTYIYKIR